VDQAPSIISAATATATHGKAFTFTFSGIGYPAPNVTHTGSVPGLAYSNKGNGTATLSGTPAVGTTGTYPITVTAANGTLPNASMPFTLTVDLAPTLTGPSKDTYTVGTAGADTFEATGVPTPTATIARRADPTSGNIRDAACVEDRGTP